MNCPKCGKRMTKTEGGWAHVYELSRYMKDGEKLCTYFVRQTEADRPQVKETRDEGNDRRITK